MVKLFIQAICKFLLGVVLVGVLLFLPAGTLAYYNGWLLMGLLFAPMFLAGILLLMKKPELLKKRLNAKEKQKGQSLVIKLSGLMFLAGFIVAGLGFRFDWYILPKAVTLAASLLFIVAYALYAEALRENVYLSRTIEVQEGQRFCTDGEAILAMNDISFYVQYMPMNSVVFGALFTTLIRVLFSLRLIRLKFPATAFSRNVDR